MILLTHWKGFLIEWKAKGYKAVRDFDNYEIPTLFQSIEGAKKGIDKIVGH